MDAGVAAVRRFNRFYTRRIGVLHEGLLDSPFTLTEVRVLYELAHRDRPTAAELAAELGLDPGYLSRLLAGFARRKLIARTRSDADARRSHLALTARGRAAFADLDARSSAEVDAMLAALPATGRRTLVDAMAAVESVLDAPAERARPSVVIRPPRPGDIGWVIHRHGALYAAEYGWDERFEALVAEVATSFLKAHDPKRERCWIAEVDGENAGSIFLVAQSKTVARLRLLLVEPSARGLGVGSRLVDECLGFARRAGYKKVVLWTNDVLDAARRIYQRAGFVLVDEQPHRDFGEGLVGQTWSLDLSGLR